MALTRDGDQGVAIATWTQGESLSDAFALGGTRAVAFMIPSIINAATSMTFQGSYNGTTWANIYTRAGVELTYTIAVDRWVIADPADFAGCSYLKIRFGTAAAAVVQSAKTMAVIAQDL